MKTKFLFCVLYWALLFATARAGEKPFYNELQSNDKAAAKVEGPLVRKCTTDGSLTIAGECPNNRDGLLFAFPVGIGGGYSYQWFLDGDPIAGANGTQYSAGTLSPGTYTLTADSGFCLFTSNAIVQYPLPDTITTGGPTTFCPGGSVILTASPAGPSYTWFDGNLRVGDTSNSLYASSSGAYTNNFTNGDGCLYAPAGSIVVTVLPSPAQPTITASGPLTFCQGSSVTLTSSSASSYQWTNEEGDVPEGTTQSVTVNNSGIYLVQITGPNGCQNFAADTVFVSALSVNIDSSGPASFCQGGSVTLTASVGQSYLWNNGSDEQSITVTEAATYVVTVTSPYGCSASTEAIVTVYALPIATITPSGPTKFCQGGSVNLTASPGTSYAWSTGQDVQTVTITTSGPFAVTVTNASNCSASSSIIEITVNPLPTATITASGPTEFCSGGSVNLTASSGSSYKWSNKLTTAAISVSKSGNYDVTVTNGNGCSAASGVTAVTVVTIPDATITAGGATTFCQGSSVKLTASAGTSYKWSSGQTTKAITAKSSGSYIVTITNDGLCTAASNKEVVTVATPAITINALGEICKTGGGTVTLTASGGSGYEWSDGATSNAITVNAIGKYTVTVTNAYGCTNSDAYTVTLTPGSCTEAPVRDNKQTGGEPGNNDNSTSNAETGLFSNSGVEVSIYPNPYTGLFHLKVLSANDANINVKIFDITGRLMDERKEIAYGTDVILGEGYAAGVYMVQVNQEEASKVLRVVKSE